MFQGCLQWFKGGVAGLCSSAVGISAFILLLSSCAPARKAGQMNDGVVKAERHRNGYPRSIVRAAALLLNDSALLDAHTGISLYDVQDRRYLYNDQGDKYFVPASNVKIATCYAAMRHLGDSLPGLLYQRDADGTLLVSGTGDPSFLHPDFREQRVYDFLKREQRVEWRSPIFEEPLGSGWSWDDYTDDYMAQRSVLPIYGNLAWFGLDRSGEVAVVPRSFGEGIRQTGESLAEGFDVFRNWDSNVFNVIAGSHQQQWVPFNANPGTMRQLLEDTLHVPVTLDPFGGLNGGNILYSVPTDSLLKKMMYRSDNFFAEQVLMMLGGNMLRTPAVRATIDTLLDADFSGLARNPHWVDGSGLSRYNLFTPRDLVQILRQMLELKNGRERLKTIFPSGGQGTLGSYYLADEGKLFAKTGTLAGVVAISGIMYTKGGKELLFSVLVNNHNGSATGVRRAVERFLQSVRQER